MTKKKWIMSGVILVCLALAVYLFIESSPRPVIGQYSLAYNIERTGTGGNSSASFSMPDDNGFFIHWIRYAGEDVTEAFDPGEVAELLSTTMSRRIFERPSSVPADHLLWDILITYGHRSKHIWLSRENIPGAFYFWYEPSAQLHHRILDPAALLNALEQMLEG